MARGSSHSTPVAATAVDLFCGAGGLTRGLLDAVPALPSYEVGKSILNHLN